MKEVIEFRAKPQKGRMIFSVEAEKVTVEWGDGYRVRKAPNGRTTYYKDIFTNDDVYNRVIIRGKDIKKFKIRKCNGLEIIHCGCPNLVGMDIYDAGLSKLNIQNAEKLKELFIPRNVLSELNLDACPSLEYLNLSNYDFAWEDYEWDFERSYRLDYDWVFNDHDYDERGIREHKTGPLKSLCLSKCPELKRLYCIALSLEHLDIRNNKKLEELRCAVNFLTELDASKNKELQFINCSDNRFTPGSVKVSTESYLVKMIPAEDSDIYEWV